jgi:hypothetical protein
MGVLKIKKWILRLLDEPNLTNFFEYQQYSKADPLSYLTSLLLQIQDFFNRLKLFAITLS